MEYYYSNKVKDRSLTLEKDEARHLFKVLRKKPGDIIFVTDGKGNVYECELRNITNEKAGCEILNKEFNKNEPEIKITLYQSLLKKPARFEFAIEKSVELGVHKIVPLITEHVINKTSERTERWEHIALSAIKQSQRCYLPEISHPVQFEKAVSEAVKYDLNIILDEKETEKEMNVIKNFQKISLFVGPEGGFTRDEIYLAKNAGFKIMSLGNRKIRSETAAIAGILKIFNNS